MNLWTIPLACVNVRIRYFRKSAVFKVDVDSAYQYTVQSFGVMQILFKPISEYWKPESLSITDNLDRCTV
jgi:hypothetical protein